MELKKIKSALISVYYKDGLDTLVKLLDKNGVKIYSTGGTQKFVEDLGVKVIAVEDLTGYPSILGGRVKTLHPKVFGGILHRRDNKEDLQQIGQYEIPEIDLVIVDLYPFEETVASGAEEKDIIEKIDIGGISLIRAAAKNFNSVVILSSKEQYPMLETILKEKNGSTDLSDRRLFAANAFDVSSHYDSAIFNYFNSYGIPNFKKSYREYQVLRYGENPHQKGVFYGKLEDMFDKLNGKELSYNNLVDVDAAVALIDEFKETTFAILKHTNACGVATAKTVKQAYLNAFACDTVSAFGGVLISNKEVDSETAEEINKLFFEVLIAPSYDKKAIEVLTAKKNRIILKRKDVKLSDKQFKTLLNGVIEQDKDLKMEGVEELKTVTKRMPSEEEKRALIFAAKICKHTKSNTIVFAKEGQLITSGVGQTSRVDALIQAIGKANTFKFSLEGAVMASDAFFPFPDCVEIANKAGIKAFIQPGGSIKDQDSIDYCDKNNMTMVFTGIRHFKH
jgi:phosphoribosylaminoimidazolecarboxamide formyltransferase / IMP cyclohydrolase